MLVINLNQCIGKLTYTVPRECVGLVKPPAYTLKIRRAGGARYVHEFAHDELDGNTVSFFLDDPIRALAIGYWQADLFAGCDWIGESLLVKSLPSVTAVTATPLTSSTERCIPDKADNATCCPSAPNGATYAELYPNTLTGCQDATNCC